MSEREVLMRIVARDVKYDESVDTYMSHAPETLTLEGPDRHGDQDDERGRGAQHPDRR